MAGFTGTASTGLDMIEEAVCPSVCLSVMLSPPKPLDEIQPNLVCE